MDKNMINIDDLLKQRLGDAEEPERAGAWTNMRDVLDQQMPVNAGASTNWRRMFFYIASVALLAAISVGGYQMVESFSADGTGTLADNSSQKPPHTGVINTAISTLPDTREETAVEEPTQNTAPVKAADVVGPARTTSTSPVAVNNTPEPKAAQPVLATSDANSSNDATKSEPTNAPVLAANNTATDIENAETTPQPAQVEAPSIAEQQADEQPTATEPTRGMNVANETTNNNNNNNAPVRAQEKALAKLDAAEPQLAQNEKAAEPEFEEKRTPYRKYVVKESVDENGELRKDTVQNTEEEWVELIAKNDNTTEPSADNTNDDNSGSNMTLSSAAPKNNTAQNLNSASNNNGNVKAKRDKGNRYTNPRRFEEMVKNAKLSMGKMKFYPGIVAGANTAFSKSNINGFQLGLAGKLTINERWSVLTEAKYNHRFNRNERFQDDYITNVNNVVVGGQPLIEYDSVEHYYNFNTLSSIEMPIALTYNYKRLYMFGGVNMTYNFRVKNIHEVEETHKREAGATSTNTNVAATDKTILLSDFKPSFGLGYVAGAGFEFNNKIKADLRLTQPLFMNTSTPGQKILADKLYKIPSVQANLTFRLGGNKFKPYKKR